jgi:hypothetical protein
MASPRRASSLNVWLALGTVYLVWGSTYLAIAIAVQTLPPLFYSGVRFFSAGLILAAWLAFRGIDLRVSRRELLGAAIVGTLLLAVANGLVNVAERTVPSGVAALIVASIPLWIVVYRKVAGEHVGRDLLAGVFIEQQVELVEGCPAHQPMVLLVEGVEDLRVSQELVQPLAGLAARCATVRAGTAARCRMPGSPCHAGAATADCRMWEIFGWSCSWRLTFL